MLTQLKRQEIKIQAIDDTKWNFSCLWMRILAERGISNQTKIHSLFLPCTSCICLFVFYLKQVFLTASMQVNCSLCMKFFRKAKNTHTYNFVYVFVYVWERKRVCVCVRACVVVPYCKDCWKPKLYYIITKKFKSEKKDFLLKNFRYTEFDIYNSIFSVGQFN
jgi:hypothetical protein